MDLSNPRVLVSLLGVAAVFVLAVRRQDHTGPTAGPHGGLASGPGPSPPTVLGLMQNGRKIEAIKLYREEHGVGLREAKEAVEALAAGRGGPAPS